MIIASCIFALTAALMVLCEMPEKERAFPKDAKKLQRREFRQFSRKLWETLWGIFARSRKTKMISLEQIQSEIDKDPENIELYLAAARLLLKQGDSKSARKYIDDAMELNAEFPALAALLKEHPAMK
jgi:hypothetical protein